MKKFILLLFFSTLFYGCKTDSKSGEASDLSNEKVELIVMKGDFIYYADAAVLQTPNEIYGVVIDEKMHELDNAVKPYKEDVTDMISVTVKVRRFEKPENEEGWPYRLEIKEILKVEKPDPNKKDIIKIGQ